MSAFRKLLTAAALVAVCATPAAAQQGPGGLINPQRDCQTITTCNFKRSGSYRGCVSSYSCRVCSFVASRRCGGRGKVCQELRCGWGA